MGSMSRDAEYGGSGREKRKSDREHMLERVEEERKTESNKKSLIRQ